METDTKSLFQITEAAHACGVSRSTLMRMEEKGLLAPAYVAPESGRRYYDNHNVARVLQIEKFKSMGLGAQEIADYFVRGGEVSGLLAVLEERLQELLQGVEELRLRAGDRSGMSVQLTSLHAVTCCMKKCMGRTVEEKYAAMYGFYSECIRKGCVLSDERCSWYRSGTIIWRAISERSPIPTGSAYRFGRNRHRRTQSCCRHVVCCPCCTTVNMTKA